MTNGENYDGAVESAKQLISIGKKLAKAFSGPEIPKDPHEVIALAQKIKNEEKVRDEADKAREYIIKTYKDRDRAARLARRKKLKGILGLKS